MCLGRSTHGPQGRDLKYTLFEETFFKTWRLLGWHGERLKGRKKCGLAIEWKRGKTAKGKHLEFCKTKENQRNSRHTIFPPPIIIIIIIIH